MSHLLAYLALFFFFFFLGATKHLYNWLCPSVGRLVGRSGNAFIRRSTRRTLLACLALFVFKCLSSGNFGNFAKLRRVVDL